MSDNGKLSQVYFFDHEHLINIGEQDSCES